VVAPVAWVIGDTGFPKYGTSSPRVARQYSGTLGKVGNCQIGVSAHAACDHASAALDWRLFIPGAWDDACTDDPDTAEQIQRRRTRADIPDQERNRPKWQLAIEMLDELRGWGLQAPVICARTPATAITPTSVPPSPIGAWTTSCRSKAQQPPMPPMRPLSNLPDHTPLPELIRLGKIRWRVEHDYRERKTGPGIDHYEGRTWTGWDRHVTLVAAAHVFLTTLRLTSPKATGAA
jgi:SRSO17 transposase